MLRADIDGDFHITGTDGYLLNSYLQRLPLSSSPTNTYPAPATNPYTNIGTTFNVIRFRLELATDRSDDYTANPVMRSTTVHPPPDIFENDGYFAQHQFVTFPVPLIFQKQLTWDASLVVSSSAARLVPTIFSSLTSTPPNSCNIDGVQCNVYASPPVFDPGKVDYFVPDNLIIGRGEIQRADGYYYKVDFEVGTIILEIPEKLYDNNTIIVLKFLNECTKTSDNHIFGTTLYDYFVIWYNKMYNNDKIIGRKNFISIIRQHNKYKYCNSIKINKKVTSGFKNLQLK